MMNHLLRLLLALTLFAVTPGYAQFADQATFVGTGGGTANAQTISIPNAVSLTNLRGVLLKYVPAASNTGATTLAVTGLTATAVLKPSNNSTLAALSGGEIRVGQPALLMYDGTEFVLFNVATGGALCGASGLTITNNGVSLVTITYLSATVTDAAGVATYLPGATVTINLAAANGAGALDAGSQTANTWYYAYLIYNGTANALGSASSTAPTVPAGYYGTCRVGAFRGGTTAATLLATKQVGNKASYLVGGTGVAALPSIISGASGSIATPTYTQVPTSGNINTFVPVTATAIDLVLYGLITTSADTGAAAAPNGSYGSMFSSTNPPPMFISTSSASSVNTLNSTLRGTFILESSFVFYTATANGGLQAAGWTDAVNAN
jgi:hypothetical protein